MHWSNRTMFDRRRTLWGGCVLRVPVRAARLLRRRHRLRAVLLGRSASASARPDIALLPIGAYEPRWFMKPFHMKPEEAVRAHRRSAPRHSIATHHSCFRLADDGFEAPARLLADARAAAGVPPDDFRILDVGETVVLGK